MEIAELIAEYVTSSDTIPDESLKEASRRFVDSLGVARAALGSPPVSASKRALTAFHGEASLIGGGRSSPDAAAFYNALAIRYLDFNDTYLSKEPLHPSDMIGGLIALATAFNKSGRELAEAIVVGYEVGVSLCDTTSLRAKGFDHVNFLQVGAAAGMARLMGLDRRATANAISMTVVPHVALRQTRVGELSMWKAGAAGEAVRNATFAVLLARQGFTGPKEPFSGKMGFINLIARDLDPTPLSKMNGRRILDTYIKYYPVEYHAQAAVEAAKKIKVKDVKKVTIETYEAGKSILADKEKWRPTNRETADHSLPYIVAVTLLRGEFWLESYDLIGDPRVLEIMDKTEVVEREDYTRVYADELPTRVIVESSEGVKEAEVRIPRGHSRNPMSDEEVLSKYSRLTGQEERLNLLQLSPDGLRWEVS
ncbi:2-methylcitrate dehydratase [Sulfodiicoccus acidiphilus]|uniref:2-methylcitrate dehydratase n=1 Tax=Sulfodiicoccus acidiphilus TaxID=1670455 RepID=A0A348B464_9CREN|nr:MmgE/PrpD family protein [Sulfodiicoccus acidiphilus]BBD72966.1 2-methylcitrate dehydratase [Sulfodiicoccus acidiphilus]GGT87659.1 2-methylcitrate dehydratase [Sulfodiicoccus acidiphilus]